MCAMFARLWESGAPLAPSSRLPYHPAINSALSLLQRCRGASHTADRQRRRAARRRCYHDEAGNRSRIVPGTSVSRFSSRSLSLSLSLSLALSLFLSLSRFFFLAHTHTLSLYLSHSLSLSLSLTLALSLCRFADVRDIENARRQVMKSGTHARLPGFLLKFGIRGHLEEVLAADTKLQVPANYSLVATPDHMCELQPQHFAARSVLWCKAGCCRASLAHIRGVSHFSGRRFRTLLRCWGNQGPP